MNLNRLFLLISGLVITIATDLTSQTPLRVDDMIVATDWLEEHLSDSLLVILYNGMKTEYEKEHIPGARYISIFDLLVENEQGIRHELPDEQTIEQVLRSYGINDNSTIIICYEDENAIPWATRLFLTLDYAGLGDQVAILNGGLKAWKDEGRSLTMDVTAFKEGNIDVRIREEVLVYKDEVLANLHNDSVIIVDARPPERYYGTEPDPNSSRSGHIEGAVNIPSFSLKNDDQPYLFKPRDELQSLFTDRQIQAGTTLITYCGLGIWASPVYFAARLLGYSVRFYDGSFQEWGSDESLPISKSNF
jgi:thiosulfate/3-mercaptopyruvate sulfurtransferase